MGKKIVPIIITLVALGFAVLYLVGLSFVLPLVSGPIGYFFLLLGIFLIFGLIVAIIYTLIERLKEIEKEKDDDLSKY